MCTIISQFMAKLKKFCASLIKINLYKQINKQKTQLGRKWKVVYKNVKIA